MFYFYFFFVKEGFVLLYGRFVGNLDVVDVISLLVVIFCYTFFYILLVFYVDFILFDDIFFKEEFIALFTGNYFLEPTLVFNWEGLTS